MTMHKVNLPPAPQSPRSIIAAWLAAQGFYVFRLGVNSKRPIAEGWQDEATNDPIEARLLFVGKNAQCNIGIRCLHHIVVDLDVKDGHDGPGDWARLLDEYADTISGTTMKALTPSGGAHYFFRLPPDTPEVRNTRGSLADGIDTRGAGGYVVGHGSSIDGRYYAIEGDRILTAPQWLIALNGAGRVRRQGADNIEGAVDDPRMIEAAIEMLEGHEMVIAGGRNNALFVVAKRLRDRGIAQDTARSLIFEHFVDTKLVPPYPYEDAEKTIYSAYKNNTTAGGAMNAAAAFEPVEALVDVAPTGLNIWQAMEGEYLGPPAHVVHGLITRGTIGMITGSSDAGKSPLMLDIGFHVALGLPWQGHKTEASYVMHLSTEGVPSLKGRIEAQRMRFRPLGLTTHTPIDLGVVSGDLAAGGAKLTKTIIADIKARIEHFAKLNGSCEPGLLVIDTISHLLGEGDEDRPTFAALLRNLKRIIAETGMAIMFVHHPTKDGSSLWRGHSSIVNDSDLLINVQVDEATRIRTITTPRIKDWASIDPMRYRLEVVNLGTFDDIVATSIRVNWDVEHVPASQEFEKAGDAKPEKVAALSGAPRRLLEALCRDAHAFAQLNAPLTEADRKFDIDMMMAFSRTKRSACSRVVNELVIGGFLVEPVARSDASKKKVYRVTEKAYKTIAEIVGNANWLQYQRASDAETE